MTWDDQKEKSPGDPEGELTSDEWNAHVQDQKNHSSRHEQGGSDVLSLVTDQIQDFGSSVVSTITGTDIEPDSVDTNSVNTEELSDGVAGDGNTISSLWGDSGEHVLLGTYALSHGDVSTTQTEGWDGFSARAVIPMDAYVDRFTNIEDIYVSWTASVSNDTEGETTSVRLNSFGGGSQCQMGVTQGENDGVVHSPREVTTNTGTNNWFVEFRVSGGTGEISGYSDTNIHVWGRIA